MSEPSAPQSPWGIRIVLGVLVIGGVTAVVLLSSRGDGSPVFDRPVPKVELTNSPVGVRDAVENALSDLSEAAGDADQWGHTAKVLYANGFSAAALECLDGAEALDSQKGAWPYLRGMIVAEESRNRGLEHIRRASELDPRNSDFRVRLADFLFELQQIEKSKQQYERVLQSEPHPGALLGMARIALARKEPKKGIDFARQAANLIPQSSEPVRILARLYRLSGDQQKLREQLEKLDTLPPQASAWPDRLLIEVANLGADPGSRHKRARQLAAGGRFDEALVIWQQLCQEEPKNPFRFQVLANELVKQRRYDRAAAVLSEAQSVGVSSADLIYLSGVVAAGKEQFAAAIGHLEHAVTLKADFAEAHHLLGTCRIETGDAEGAISAFRDVLRFEPLYAPAHLKLGELLLRRREYDDAVFHLEQAGRLDVGQDPHTARLLKQARAGAGGGTP